MPKLLSINNMPDHFHILIGQKPNVALSNLVATLRPDPPDSSMVDAGLRADFHGRKASARFPTSIHS
jgi:hypothetical protein